MVGSGVARVVGAARDHDGDVVEAGLFEAVAGLIGRHVRERFNQQSRLRCQRCDRAKVGLADRARVDDDVSIAFGERRKDFCHARRGQQSSGVARPPAGDDKIEAGRFVPCDDVAERGGAGGKPGEAGRSRIV